MCVVPRLALNKPSSSPTGWWLVLRRRAVALSVYLVDSFCVEPPLPPAGTAASALLPRATSRHSFVVCRTPSPPLQTLLSGLKPPDF